MWKEAFVAYFNVVVKFAWRYEGKPLKTSVRIAGLRQRFEPGISGKSSKSKNC
jgi:hypothetical protein